MDVWRVPENIEQDGGELRDVLIADIMWIPFVILIIWSTAENIKCLTDMLCVLIEIEE
jgi:hypothetical protein